MNNTSAIPIGLTVIQLTAALTAQQWSDLDRFATNRLRRTTGSNQRQRLNALHCPRSLVHAAIEQFVLGDADLPGGRKLKPHQRVDADAFIHAVQAAVNSLLSHMLERQEFQREHLAIGPVELTPDGHEPREPSSLPAELEVRDLQRNLFDRLAMTAGGDPELQAALQSLQDDCVTGHVMGASGFAPEAKRRVRAQARQTWENLTL